MGNCHMLLLIPRNLNLPYAGHITHIFVRNNQKYQFTSLLLLYKISRPQLDIYPPRGIPRTTVAVVD